MLSNAPGTLAVLASEVAAENSNITNIRIKNRNHDFFEVMLDVEVQSTDHVHSIITSLLSKNEIHSVERAKL
ncbi:MAG UNVERIFIED_CONTAM: hypothetical protein LVQ98_02965 [Rickettsiaceae bacterium]